MKKIILIDDEPRIRQHIKSSYPWQDWGFEIVGEASHGGEALKLCAELKPDIALIDITMPVMDGITLLDHLNSEFPNMRSIMLTVHRDFHYVQQSIQKGAIDYILKSPINASQTKAALDRACKELEKENVFHQNKLFASNYQYPLRKNIFQHILTGVLSREDEIFERCRSLSIDLNANSYLFLLCHVNDLEKFQLRYSEEDQSLMEFSMLEIVRETLEQENPGKFELFPLSPGKFVVLFLEDQPPQQLYQYQSDVFQRCNSFQDKLDHYMNLQLSITVSASFPSINQIRKVYFQLQNHLSHHFYTTKSTPLLLENIVPFQSIPEKEIKELKERFLELTQNYSVDSLKIWMKKAENLFSRYKPEPASVCIWLNSLKTELFNESKDDLYTAPEWPPFEQANRLTTALQLLLNWVEKWQNMNKRLVNVRPDVAHAIDYIKQNLDKELTVNLIAQKVQISPSYLGHLFKQEVGVSVIEYIVDQRIDLAKKHLVNGQYRNYELADKIGIHNYTYFCTLFKKHVGMTPNEYKRTNKRKKTL